MAGYRDTYGEISTGLLLFVSLVYCSCSCNPTINSFKVTTHDSTQVRRMTTDDTLKVNWDVKGKPTLLIHESQLPDSAGKVIELKLVVEKAGKEANRIVQVQVVPANSETTITFRTRLSGDTLIAEGINDPGVYGDRFEVIAVSNASDRPLSVIHADKTGKLDNSSITTDAFAGTPVEGKWEFRTLITPAEKKDHTLLPEKLKINVTINYKRR